MVINIKQKKVRKLIDFIITIFGWLFLLAFLYNMIRLFDIRLNLQFYSLNLVNANAIVLFTIFALVASATALVWWSTFNKRKYGPLKRRKFPTDTDNKDVAEFFNVSNTEVETYQKDKYVEVN